MDDAGIAVQVPSNSGPGPDLVPGPDGVAMAREMNDHLADQEHRRAVNEHLTKGTARRMAAKFCQAVRLSYQSTYLKVVEGRPCLVVARRYRFKNLKAAFWYYLTPWLARLGSDHKTFRHTTATKSMLPHIQLNTERGRNKLPAKDETL